MQTLMAGIALSCNTLVGTGPSPGPPEGPRANPSHLHVSLRVPAGLALLGHRLVGLPQEGGDLRQDGSSAEQEYWRTALTVRVHCGLVHEVLLLVLHAAARRGPHLLHHHAPRSGLLRLPPVTPLQ